MKNLITAAIFVSMAFISFAQDTIYVPSEQPTIQAGIDAANNGDVVLVAEGTYYENINYNGKAITLASYFLIDRDESHIQNTIIDGSQPVDSVFGCVVRFYMGEDTTSVLCGFTITGGFGVPHSSYSRAGGGIQIYNSAPIIRNNIIEFNKVESLTGHVSGSAMIIEAAYDKTVIVENNIIRNNIAKSDGATAFVNGTINIRHGSCIIRNNTITDNLLSGTYVLNGGGIDAFGVNNPNNICYIENNIIARNYVESGVNSQGGGIYDEDFYVVIKNNIIANNSANVGGGIFYRDNLATPAYNSLVANNTIIGNSAQYYGGALSTNEIYEITNCIIWGNSSPPYWGTAATITYSDIEESYTGVGNISLEPEFQDTTYYLLANSSPCIDAGNPDPIFNDVEDPFNPGYPLWPAMGTLTNDMGHCGGPNSYWPNVIINAIEDDGKDNYSPDEFSLYQNYPNPFNPSTKIKFSIPQLSNVEVKVFDILGNEIATLIDEEKPAGTYELTWYASNLPSGVYFYQLKAGQFIETKKMLLLK